MSEKKLVRDKIHEIYKERPRHIADDEEYAHELIRKLQNESEEFRTSFSIDNLVDILEIVYALTEFKGVSIQEIENIRKDKASKRGRFKKRIIFEEAAKRDDSNSLSFEE